MNASAHSAALTSPRLTRVVRRRSAPSTGSHYVWGASGGAAPLPPTWIDTPPPRVSSAEHAPHPRPRHPVDDAHADHRHDDQYHAERRGLVGATRDVEREDPDR